MRTKTILLGAAIVAAGALSSMAQSNVYSVNVVGYVNVTLTNNQFVMISNPLDLDGTGTNNTLNTALKNLPDSTVVFKFSGGAFEGASFAFGGSWFPNKSFNPGEGAFILNSSGTNTTVTIAGQVLQGAQTKALVSGFQIVSSKFPISGGTGTSLGLTNQSDSDTIFTWNTGGQAYNGASFSFGGSWFPERSIAVGESFFLFSSVATNWNKTFTVQ